MTCVWVGQHHMPYKLVEYSLGCLDLSVTNQRKLIIKIVNINDKERRHIKGVILEEYREPEISVWAQAKIILISVLQQQC